MTIFFIQSLRLRKKEFMTTPFLLYPLTVALLLLATSARAEPIPQAPQIPVRAYILDDFHSGATLAQENADERMEPASITKIMAAYIIYRNLREGAINLEDQVTISEKAWRMEGSRMFVEVDTRVSVQDLLLGIVVQSGNDATVAMAEHIAGDENTFAEMMNQQAASLGLTNSHFVNASGMPDPEHYMSARDIAILVRAVIREFPDYYAQYAIREFEYNGITQPNRNRLLWQDASVDGVKTGYTRSAGYCLSTSAKRGDTRLISVVLGAENIKSRFGATKALLNYGFRFFETHKLYEAAKPLTQARIWKGEHSELPLGLSQDLFVTIPKGRYEELNAALNINNTIEAPIAKDAPLGTVTVTLDDDTVAEQPLVALQDVAEGGMLDRLYDSALMIFNSYFD